MLDLLDPGAVRNTVLESAPDAIVHQATAFANVTFSKDLDRSFALMVEAVDLLGALHLG